MAELVIDWVESHEEVEAANAAISGPAGMPYVGEDSRGYVAEHVDVDERGEEVRTAVGVMVVQMGGGVVGRPEVTHWHVDKGREDDSERYDDVMEAFGGIVGQIATARGLQPEDVPFPPSEVKEDERLAAALAFYKSLSKSKAD